jgi:hypothetical protein
MKTKDYLHACKILEYYFIERCIFCKMFVLKPIGIM